MDLIEVETAAGDLRNMLVGTLPGDLGRIARRVVGIGRVEVPAKVAVPSSPSPHGSVASGETLALTSANPIAWSPYALGLCCQTYGRPLDMAVPVGVCLELLGIVSAALDAAQDGHYYPAQMPGESTISHSNESRDHVLGAALLSNAGVALIGLAWQALFAYGPQYGVSSTKIVEIARLITDHWTPACHAQHLDLTVGRTLQPTLEEYEQIVAGKAGEIGGTACEAGAILADATPQRALWHTLGAERTIAQQLCDDAKDLERDLAQGHQISQAVRYGLAVADPAQRQALLALLEQARLPAGGAARQMLLQQLEELGAVHYVLVRLALHRQRALDALQALALPEANAAWFEQWILETTRVRPISDDPIFAMGEP